MRAALLALTYISATAARPNPIDAGGKHGVFDSSKPVYRRSPDVIGDIASTVAIAAKAGAIGVKAFVAPSKPDITEWTAIGDSFTAGIGSNDLVDYIEESLECDRFLKAYPPQINANDKLPGDAKTRKLNFGACSGNVMKDVREKQLDGGNKALGYEPFGKPQIAVMTISGNDLGFSDAINSCVIRAHGWPRIPDCDKVLKDIETKLASTQFLDDLDNTFLAVVKQGQANGGANPPEAFQLFVNGYIPFWNEVDKGCDTISWEWWTTTKDHLLTTQLRKRMNDLVRSLNFEIKRSALRLQAYGVVYVEGFQDAYDGHQFCDPQADSNLAKPTSANTWFWGSYSPWNRGEGPALAARDAAAGVAGAVAAVAGAVLDVTNGNMPEMVLEALVPKAEDRAAIKDGKADPSQFNDAFTSADKFAAALETIKTNDVNTTDLIPVQWKRIFHPKGTAYGENARVNVEKIIAARQANGNSQPSPTSTSVVPSQTSTPTGTTAPQPSCPVSNDDHWPKCEECPNWSPSPDRCIASEFSAACTCPDPCPNVKCIY